MDASRMAGRRTGVGRYLEYLLESWSAQPMPFDRIELLSPTPIGGVPNGARFQVRVMASRWPGGWWQTTRLRPCASKLDVLFAPYTIPPGYRGRSVVSNLGILEGPNRVPGVRAQLRSWHFAHSARRADAVIANSQTTKSGLVEYFGVPAEKVTVVWPGVDEAFRPPAKGEEEAIRAAAGGFIGQPDQYLLYVGKLSLRRHVPELLEAFAEVAAGRPDLRLLFVGPNSGNVPLAETVSRLRLDGSVRHIQHLDQDDLALLYRGALAFVLPTAQEGFSATILEALASGCPVLTLDHSALREAGLDEAVLTMPDARPETLAHALRRVVEDAGRRAQLSQRSPQYAKAFSWEKTARETMEVVTRVAQR